MNNIWECFETEAFNELINFSFQEVREAFNYYRFFFACEQEEEIIKDILEAKDWYSKELDAVEAYAHGEYAQKKNSEIYIPEYAEPIFKINRIENQTKSELIRIIEKYFNKERYQLNKHHIYEQGAFKEEAIETPHEMLVALNVNKNRIYSLLSILGYYQRHCRYFVSQAAFLNICLNYSNQVYAINKNLGMEYRFVNIFISNSRIKPPKCKKSDGSVENNIANAVTERYQSHKFIDIDKISLLMLIQPYLKHNTKEVKTIIEIMMKNFDKYKKNSALAWKVTMAEVDAYIAECELKGIMRRLAYYD
jgi:hypothetical protein